MKGACERANGGVGMRRFRIMGLVLVAVLAVGAMSASVASAKKANLVLREGGEHLYEGLDPVIPTGGPSK